MGFRFLFSLLLLSSCFIINVFAQAPLHAPSFPPLGALPPHHHHHKGHGGHHHKPATPPTPHPPTVAPVHPPVKAPVHPPVKAPIHPPVKAPVHPPVKAPVHPPVKAPVKAPVHPPVKAPVHPPVKAPVHPPVKSKAPVHPPVKAPVHPPVKAPVHPPVKAPVHSPVMAPVHPPVKAPVHPPVKAPAPAPSHAPVPVRRQVAVRGMVYCKSCKYKGVETLTGATPLEGAVVVLTCNNTKYPLRVRGTTDKNGFFFIMPPKTLTTFGTHKCKVKLLSSPKLTCNRPTNLNYGLKGATLIPSPKPTASPPLPFDVFTVGPFAFEPRRKLPCLH